MEYRKLLKSQVEKKFDELQEYSSVYSKLSTSNRKKIMEEHKVQFAKDPSKVDIKEIARDLFYINGFYQTDIRKLQNQLLDIYTFAKDVDPEIEFSKELTDVITVLKNSLPKQLFVVTDGELQEIEEGKMEELKESFDVRGYYSIFEKQVKTILNA